MHSSSQSHVPFTECEEPLSDEDDQEFLPGDREALQSTDWYDTTIINSVCIYVAKI